MYRNMSVFPKLYLITDSYMKLFRDISPANKVGRIIGVTKLVGFSVSENLLSELFQQYLMDWNETWSE